MLTESVPEVPEVLGTLGQFGPSCPASGSFSWQRVVVVHQSGHLMVCSVVVMMCSLLVGIGTDSRTYRTQIARQPNESGP